MPAEVDEEKWGQAKAAVRKQYPDIDEEDDRFWKLTSSIYHKMNKTKKSLRLVVNNSLAKAKRIVGHMTFQGIPIAIETPDGKERHWYDPFVDVQGSTRMEGVSYGEIPCSLGLDGDALDCFVGKHEDAPSVYLVMIRVPPLFEEDDEMKVFLGFRSEADVMAQFQLCYSDPRFIGRIDSMPIEEFRLRCLTGEVFKSHGRLQKSPYCRQYYMQEGDGSMVCVREEWEPKHPDHPQYLEGDTLTNTETYDVYPLMTSNHGPVQKSTGFWLGLKNALLLVKNKPKQEQLVVKASTSRGKRTGGYWREIWQRPGEKAWVSPHLMQYHEGIGSFGSNVSDEERQGALFHTGAKGGVKKKPTSRLVISTQKKQHQGSLFLQPKKEGAEEEEEKPEREAPQISENKERPKTQLSLFGAAKKKEEPKEEETEKEELKKEEPQAEEPQKKDSFTVDRNPPFKVHIGDRVQVKIGNRSFEGEVKEIAHDSKKVRVVSDDSKTGKGSLFNWSEVYPPAAGSAQKLVVNKPESGTGKITPGATSLPPAKTTSALEDTKQGLAKLHQGQMSAKELQSFFQQTLKNKGALHDELVGKTLRELAPRGAGSKTKGEIVDHIVDQILQRFALGQAVTWHPMSEKYEDALTRAVSKITDEDIHAAVKGRADTGNEKEKKDVA